MNTPKVIYEVPSLGQQISLFKYFVNINEKFRNNLYLEYPKLKDQDLEKHVRILYQTKKEELEDVKGNAQISWNINIIEEKILKEFSNILQREWELETIPGGISLIPFSIRDLEKKRFDVYYKKDILNILKTTTHELFHFIYFDKWQDIFPNTTIEEMDYPNPVWALSEIVLPIMLNNSKIKDILGIGFKNYSMFENEILEGEKVVLHIERIYKENELEVFLRKSHEYILRYYELRNRNNE